MRGGPAGQAAGARGPGGGRRAAAAAGPAPVTIEDLQSAAAHVQNLRDALQAAQALIGQDAQVAAGNVAAGLQGAITPKIQHTASVNGHGASGGKLVPTMSGH